MHNEDREESVYMRKMAIAICTIGIIVMINFSYAEAEIDLGSAETESVHFINEDDEKNYLKVFRINEEGLQPFFSREIFEYYLLVDESVNNLDITAIPENKDDIVEIVGNSNFKNGLNKIEVIVRSSVSNKKKVYYIYVTKTANKEKANALLETLALENAILNEELKEEQTYYSAELANDVDSLNILAIPESEKARVEIIGNKSLQIGHNMISILVTAENGFTTRQYQIDVYRRNADEEKKKKQNDIAMAQRVNELLNAQEEAGSNAVRISTVKENRSNGRNGMIVLIGIVIIVIIVCIVYWLRKRKRT